MGLCIRRDAGLLKRMRGTPMPVAAMVVGVVVSALVTAVILVALTAAAGHVLYAAPWPVHWLPTAVTVILGGVVFCVLGMAITVVIPNADAAIAVINISYLPLLFISGFFFSFRNTVLNDIATVFPIYWFKEAMVTAFGAKPSAGGWDDEDLLVLLAWGAAASWWRSASSAGCRAGPDPPVGQMPLGTRLSPSYRARRARPQTASAESPAGSQPNSSRLVRPWT